MSPLLRKSSKSKLRARSQTIALVDVGSGSVGAALVEVSPGTMPVVRAHTRGVLKPGYRSIAELEEQLMRAVRNAAHSLGTSRRKPSHVAVFLPAPWATLGLHKVRFAQERAFLANQKLLSSIISEHVNADAHSPESEAEATEAAQELQTEGEVFERVVAGIRLNGYVAPTIPEEAAVFKVEVMMAVSRAAKTFMAGIEGILGDIWTDTDVSFHSSVLSAAHATATLAHDAESFLLCDGEGELAELMLVRETIPEAHATIPVGYATILRTLSMHSGITHEELPSFLKLIQGGGSPLAHAAEEAVHHAARECANALGAAEPLCHIAAPSVAYVVGDGPEAAWFAGAVEKSPRLRLALPRGFRAHVITAATLLDHVEFVPQEGSRTHGDAMLGLHAIFAGHRFGSGEIQKFYSNTV